MASLRVGRVLTNGMFRMNVVGLLEFQRTLENLYREGAGLNEEIEQAVQEGLEMVKEAAVAITPIRTGYLRSTALTSVTRGRNGRLRGFVGFGASYSKWVHENPDAIHAEGTTWKFLEIAFMQLQPKLGQIIKAATKRAISTAVRKS